MRLSQPEKEIVQKERISIEILHTYKLREETVTSEYDMTQERER